MPGCSPVGTLLKEPIMDKLIAIAIAWIIGAFCCQYTLWCCFAKDLPWYLDALFGLLSPVWITTSILSWVATLCDVATPFFV